MGKLLVKHSLQGVLDIFFFNSVSLTSRDFTWYTNYYSIADNKRGICILVELQAKYCENSALNKK